MSQNSYHEEILNQITFLKKLKEETNDTSLISNIDSLIVSVYNDLIPSINCNNIDKDTGIDSLIKENMTAQTISRNIVLVNLAVIIITILSFSWFLFNAYKYTNNLSGSYLRAEQNRASILDSLNSVCLKNYNKVFQNSSQITISDNTDSLNIPKLNTSFLKTTDSIRQNVSYLDSTISKIYSNRTDYSKAQPILIFHVFMMIAFIIAIISVVIYIVKVMINLIRYNSILADHYDALAGTFKLIKNKRYFSDDLTLESAYLLMHPQREKLLEFSNPLDLNTDKIIEQLNVLTDKKSKEE